MKFCFIVEFTSGTFVDLSRVSPYLKQVFATRLYFIPSFLLVR